MNLFMVIPMVSIVNQILLFDRVFGGVSTFRQHLQLKLFLIV